MSFLTDAQIALAHDMEVIKEALAGGFELPPRPTILDTPFAQKMRAQFEDENQKRRDEADKSDEDRQREANDAMKGDQDRKDTDMKADQDRKMKARFEIADAVDTSKPKDRGKN